jgi:hypothetical protein
MLDDVRTMTLSSTIACIAMCAKDRGLAIQVPFGKRDLLAGRELARSPGFQSARLTLVMLAADRQRADANQRMHEAATALRFCLRQTGNEIGWRYRRDGTVRKACRIASNEDPHAPCFLADSSSRICWHSASLGAGCGIFSREMTSSAE